MQSLTFSAGRIWRQRQVLPDLLAAQAGRLFLFAPIMLALGIGAYFALPREPSVLDWGAVAGILILALGGLRRLPDQMRPLLLGSVLVLTGAALAGWRTHQVAAPVLEFRFYGAIEGRILKVDRSASDSLRLTLDQVVLEGVAASRTPARVRISLHGPQDHILPVPGLHVMATGHLGPPAAASEPGGFDFRRHAWFERLGAVGYTRSPVLAIEAQAQSGITLWVSRLRSRISNAVQVQLPGEAGGFAAAILTGDRAGISQAAMEDLRRSNLAHLLAISGLHMGLLTGLVFGLLRLVMVLSPYVALRWPTRKIAAVGAIAAGAFYLVLSGGNVATERAFVMVLVMFCAILIDRRAISLRSVAVAALVILSLRPESLLQAGFQMSFAATVALVAVFRALSEDRAWRRSIPRWLWPVASVVICSVVAGIATAPVAAASFNRLAEYGLLANLLAVPLMGTVIMPAAVLAAALAPFGLEWVGLKIMEPAILWILQVARLVSGFDGAVMPVAQPAPWVLPAMALGGCFLVIWQGVLRWAGAAVIVLATLGWSMTPRPTLLIAPEGELVGLMLPEGRALSRARGAGFVADSWLRSDGDDAAQAQAHARLGSSIDSPGLAHLRGGGFEVVHLHGQRGAAMLHDLCLPGRIVVMSVEPEARSGGCQLITPRDLRLTGALAADLYKGELRWRSVAETSGSRPWSR